MKLIHVSGHPSAPTARRGQSTITLLEGGRFTYRRDHHGMTSHISGTADPALLPALVHSLQAGSFPKVPPHDIPPGSSIVRITVEGQGEAALDFFQGVDFDGYRAVLMWGMAWSRWLSRYPEGGDPPPGLTGISAE